MNLKLEKLLSYSNRSLILRYNQDFPTADIPAEVALTELLKYMWLCLKHESDLSLDPNNKSLHFKCYIHPEMSGIDNMWHTFLLFTKEYQVFCADFLEGIFFHHSPFDPPKADISPQKYKQELTRYLNYIADHLGEETLVRWMGTI